MFSASFITLALALSVSARPFGRRAAVDEANGKAADALNTKFASLTANSPCQAGEDACVGDKFALCDNGKLSVQACGPGTICKALPLTNSAGTTVTCTTQADFEQRMAATGVKIGSTGAAGDAAAGNAAAGNGATASSSATGAAASKDAGAANNAASGGAAQTGNNNTGNAAAAGGNAAAAGGAGGDPQKSLTLDPSVIAKGFAQDGQGGAAADPGQAPSLTSTNNFINFCVGKTITDGKQIKTGSCNPAPIGDIPSTDKIPSSKFLSPKNGDTIGVNQAFTIKMNIKNLKTGTFVNAQTNYYSAPQQLDGGLIVGHSHFVVESIAAKDATDPLDPLKFAFFKGINTAAQGGVLSTDVTDGLPAGEYRLCSINASSNHQPVIAPVAQHGSLDDCVYFTAGGNGAAAAGGNANAGKGAAAGANAASSAGGGAKASATAGAQAQGAKAGAAGAKGGK